MPQTLYLLRHAHAVHDPRYADFDRPLTAEGRREAAEIGALMAARGDHPARILCSTAQRTRETLTGVLGALGHDCWIELTRHIYDASDESLLDLIREQSDTPSLLLIGHNPGLEQLARALAGAGDESLRCKLGAKFPPGALAVIEFDEVSWHEVQPGKGRLVSFDLPLV